MTHSGVLVLKFEGFMTLKRGERQEHCTKERSDTSLIVSCELV